MTTVYIMRHGETELNREKRLQGLADCPLNQKGISQAEDTGRRIHDAGLSFDRIYSSDLSRAVQTAELAARVHREDIVLDARLEEIDYGPYDALPFTELGEDMLSFFRDPVNVQAPEGVESIASVMCRVEAFLNELKSKDTGGCVLVVTHGVAIRAVLGLLSGRDTAVWGMPVENCVLYKTRLENGEFSPLTKEEI